MGGKSPSIDFSYLMSAVLLLLKKIQDRVISWFPHMWRLVLNSLEDKYSDMSVSDYLV